MPRLTAKLRSQHFVPDVQGMPLVEHGILSIRLLPDGSSGDPDAMIEVRLGREGWRALYRHLDAVAELTHPMPQEATPQQFAHLKQKRWMTSEALLEGLARDAAERLREAMRRDAELLLALQERESERILAQREREGRLLETGDPEAPVTIETIDLSQRHRLVRVEGASPAAVRKTALALKSQHGAALIGPTYSEDCTSATFNLWAG